jgi:alkanesulfonate monooxygenase SsuD/methylene tetrahydromethanopterin reductase-like flavin-dependent oxidoreductase (luciferase family)
MSEAELYRSRLDEALQSNPGCKKPDFAMMRHTCVYTSRQDRETAIKSLQRQLSQFENLFKNLGDVECGFPRSIPLSELANRTEYDPRMLETNLMFGSPEEVIAKLRLYEKLGVDHFTYYASMGLPQADQKRSLRLFMDEVMPAFR